jgi:hypothetical protein
VGRRAGGQILGVDVIVQVLAYSHLDRLNIDVMRSDASGEGGTGGLTHWRRCSVPMPEEVAGGSMIDVCAFVAETMLDLAYGR